MLLSTLGQAKVNEMANYKQEVTKAMEMLAAQPNVLFLGQTVLYPGSILSDTLRDIPMSKKLELPVAEEMQLGMSIGLALDGYLPISIYPRIDFLLLACNQLSNHLDVLEEMSHREWRAKVIIRTIIGSGTTFDSGLQHSRNHTEVFKALLKNVEVVRLDHPTKVVPAYKRALESDKSTLMIEEARLY